MTNGDKGGRGLLVGGDVTMHLLVFKMMEMETKPELTTIKLSTFILISVRSNSKSTSLAQGLYRHYMSHEHYMSQQHYMSQSTLYVARSTLYVAINIHLSYPVESNTRLCCAHDPQCWARRSRDPTLRIMSTT